MPEQYASREQGIILASLSLKLKQIA